MLGLTFKGNILMFTFIHPTHREDLHCRHLRKRFKAFPRLARVLNSQLNYIRLLLGSYFQ